MANIEIRSCSGDGLGFCVSCVSFGRWNSQWMCFLHYLTVDNMPLTGCYCSKCAFQLASELGRLLNGGVSNG